MECKNTIFAENNKNIVYMKKFLILFLSILPYVLHAQETSGLSFLKEGKEWKYEWVNIYIDEATKQVDREAYTEFSFVVQGDTLVDGVAYKKMQADTTLTKFPFTRWLNDQIIREENGKVYGTYYPNRLSPSKTDTIELLFDFNMQIGEPWKAGYMQPQAKDVQVVNIRGIDRKVIYFDYGKYLVEGIGHICEEFTSDHSSGHGSCGWMPHQWIYLSSMYEDSYFDLQSCWEDGVCVFSKNEDMEVIRSAATAVKEVQKASPSGVFYDLQGRRVQGQPKHGVYIQNGRKVMVK